MYTSCPTCNKQFRVHAEHVAVASGEVLCGFCGNQFNALKRLCPMPKTRSIPRFIKLRKESPNSVPENVAISAAEQVENKPSQLPTLDNIYQDKTHKKSMISLEELERVIFSSHPIRSSANIFWIIAICLAFFIVITQSIWFNRDKVLQEYPDLRPYANQLCDWVGCQLIRYRDVAAIELINRDVRVHPRYDDALLVNATIINQLDEKQPYPKIQLTLFDTSGKMVGHRSFKPSEYLDESISMNDGMPIKAPLHLVLEVLSVQSDAVSFEFRFL